MGWKRDPISAIGWATWDTYNLTVGTLQGAWQVISGLRSANELGGPVKILQMTGEVGQLGILPIPTCGLGHHPIDGQRLPRPQTPFAVPRPHFL